MFLLVINGLRRVENMRCSKCETEIAEGSLFCNHCGHQLSNPSESNETVNEKTEPANSTNTNSNVTKPFMKEETKSTGRSTVETSINVPISIKIRHGFTTFFLWLILILNGLLGLYYLLTESTDIPKYLLEDGDNAIIQGICCLASFVFTIMIMSWNKKAFYLSSFVNIASSFFMKNIGGYLVLNLLSIAIFFGILKLRNPFGKSTWDQLE